MKAPLFFFFFKVDILQNSVPPRDIKREATHVRLEWVPKADTWDKTQ